VKGGRCTSTARGEAAQPRNVLGCNAQWLGPAPRTLSWGTAVSYSADIALCAWDCPAAWGKCVYASSQGAHMWRGGGGERGRTGTAEARGV
jgi:hypothetical protein